MKILAGILAFIHCSNAKITVQSRLHSLLTNANPTTSTHLHMIPSYKPESLVDKSSFLEPSIRAVRFWKQVGPIVLHYKFTEIWFKIAQVDTDVRKKTWDKLHSIHAQTGLNVILELR